MLVVLSSVDAVVCIDCHLLPLARRVVPTIQTVSGLILNQKTEEGFSARTRKHQHVRDSHEPPTLIRGGQ